MQVLTADPHTAQTHRGRTQHGCGAITVAASEVGRPLAAAVRVATSGVETREGEQVGAPDARRARRSARPAAAGAWAVAWEEAATKRAAKGAVRARR